VVNNRNACFDSTTSWVAVGDPVKADFELETFGECNDSLTVIAYNLTKNADNYLWQFEGWGTTTDESPILYYTQASDYQVDLIATNRYGCEDTASSEIHYEGAVARFSYEQEEICTPSTVHFTDESVDAASWEWDFGDGTPPVFDQNPTHIYTESGWYTTKLIVSYQGICQDTFVHPVKVEVRQSPRSELDYTQLRPENEGHFQFNDLSKDPGDRLRWDFGDGGVSFEKDPMHTYSSNPSLLCDCNPFDRDKIDSLSYRVTLTQINENGCTAIDTGYVHPHIHGLYVPNAIIPSGEALDNQFQVRAFGLCKLHIALYNHWGNKVWEWNSAVEGNDFDPQGQPLGGWDGTLNGLDVGRNVLIWRIHEVKFSGCKTYDGPTQGTLTVIH
jgi:PKD repeat protein